MKEPSGMVFIIAGVAALLVEMAMLALVMAGDWSLAAAGLVHAAVVLALSLWTLLSPACRKDLRMPFLLTTMTCFMGPLGAFGVTVTMALTKLYGKSATPFEEWYASLFPEAQAQPAAGFWHRVLSRGDLDQGSVAPFSDILFFGSLAQKQELISLVAKNFRPVFSPVLRMALDDSNNAIRVHAASAITTIEDEFLKRTLDLSAAVRRRPGDPSTLLRLARLNDEYAVAGILDRDRERQSREQAREAYREYLRLEPKDTEARTAIGRLLLIDRKYEEAANWLEESIRQDEPQPLLLYMEALYNLGRFGDLRELVSARYSDLIQRGGMTLEAVETIKLWANAT